jgi:hypothetical protein
MTKAEARRVVWERLATTARADRDNGDWMHDEVNRLETPEQRLVDGRTERIRDLERLDEACESVAVTIERMYLRKSR